MEIVHVDSDNFRKEVIEENKKVLVDFFATWCGPCTMLTPVIEQIAKEHDEIKVCKVDVDKAPEIAMQYGIVSVPTLIVTDKGKEVQKSIGLVSKAQIEQLIK
ncbi:MAG: thioredoxin [Butyrivibrio sp.]